MVPQSVPHTVRRAGGGARGMGRKHSSRQTSTDTVGKGVSNRPATSPRLTHCNSSISMYQKLTNGTNLVIALPIGHHAGLRELVGRFGQSLLNDTNLTIPGLDKSVLIPPRRLHFTLGVMSLAKTAANKSTVGTMNQSRTVEEAVLFLKSLKPHVDDLLRVAVSGQADQIQKTRVVLNSMDVMKLEKGGGAHVLWIGPKDGNSDRFRQICDFIHSSFRNAGFLVEEDRPLKLHCTIINTAHRKPRPRKRVPFVYPELLKSSWFSQPKSSTPLPQRPTSKVDNRHLNRGPIGVDFGTWDIDEIQICEMGSHGPEGEYVCVGDIAL